MSMRTPPRINNATAPKFFAIVNLTPDYAKPNSALERRTAHFEVYRSNGGKKRRLPHDLIKNKSSSKYQSVLGLAQEDFHQLFFRKTLCKYGRRFQSRTVWFFLRKSLVNVSQTKRSWKSCPTRRIHDYTTGISDQNQPLRHGT